MHGRV